MIVADQLAELKCYFCGRAGRDSRAQAEYNGWSDIEPNYGKPDGHYLGVCPDAACRRKRSSVVEQGASAA